MICACVWGGPRVGTLRHEWGGAGGKRKKSLYADLLDPNAINGRSKNVWGSFVYGRAKAAAVSSGLSDIDSVCLAREAYQAAGKLWDSL